MTLFGKLLQAKRGAFAEPLDAERCRCGSPVNPWEAAQCDTCHRWLCERCTFGVGTLLYHTGCVARDVRRVVEAIGCGDWPRGGQP